MKVSQCGKSQELWVQRISSLELPASEITAQINASQSSSNRHISTSTVQRRLCESGLQGQIAAKKPLLKDTNNKKRLAWAKKHEQWTLDWCKSVLWSDKTKCDFFCETQSRWTDDLRKCGSLREAWRRWCDGALLVTLSVIYLEFKAHLTSMATTAFCSNMPYHLGWLVGLSFVFQKESDTTHLQPLQAV